MTEEGTNILFEIERESFKSFSKDDPNTVNEAKEELLKYELIRPRSKHSYELTREGKKAIEMGGFNAWLKSIEEEQSKDSQLKELRLKELKGNIFHLEYWWVILLLSGIVGFITGNFELILSWFK